MKNIRSLIFESDIHTTFYTIKSAGKSSTELASFNRSLFPPLGRPLVALALNPPGLHLLQSSLLRDMFLVGFGFVICLQEGVRNGVVLGDQLVAHVGGRYGSSEFFCVLGPPKVLGSLDLGRQLATLARNHEVFLPERSVV